MVVAQLVEQLLRTIEIHGLNPDIGKIEKMKIKKRGWEWPIFKKLINQPSAKIQVASQTRNNLEF